MKTTRQKAQARDKANKKQAKRRAEGRVYVVVHDELYASVDGPTSWTRTLDQAIQFSSRSRAENYAKEIKSGPRQFAGLGSKSRVVLLPSKDGVDRG